MPIGVSRQIDGQIGDLHRGRVHRRHAAVVKLHAQRFQPQLVNIRSSPHRSQNCIGGETIADAADGDAAFGLRQLDRRAKVEGRFLGRGPCVGRR